MKTIVLGYDGTEPSVRALDRTAQLGLAFGANVVVTAVEPSSGELVDPGIAPTMPGAPATTPPGALEESLPPLALDPAQTSTSPAVSHLEHARALLEERGVSVDCVPATGEPAETIAALADSRSADLIVVGTRDLGILERLLGKSVSRRVARIAHRDVLIVH
jgi:nucleotide-binding universal stress UspA family protein